ncbi:hypothetical protein R3P38DRAFT_3199298 [Favolaschia claudopus]|uniref:Uncharacterized protein n=1 Tax=Favolaschia claudopus TaxID=2862362 RepID=A0AAW0B173_9AGAR
MAPMQRNPSASVSQLTLSQMHFLHSLLRLFSSAYMHIRRLFGTAAMGCDIEAPKEEPVHSDPIDHHSLPTLAELAIYRSSPISFVKPPYNEHISGVFVPSMATNLNHLFKHHPEYHEAFEPGSLSSTVTEGSEGPPPLEDVEFEFDFE